MKIEYPFKKKSQYNKLDQVEVYMNDTSDFASDSFVLSDFPEELTAGKNSFKIKGNEFSLKLNSQILIEVIDSLRNPIFHEVNNYVDRQGRRIVTIYVYPDTGSEALITILGILKDEYVPEEWQSRFNIKWQKRIPIDFLKRNQSEIIFNRFPSIIIQEQFRPNTTLDFGSGNIITLNSSSFNSSTLAYSYPYSGRKLAKNIDSIESLFTSNEFTKTNASQSAQINLNSNIFVQNQNVQVFDYRISSPYGYYLSDSSNPTVKLTLTGSNGFNKKLIGGQLTVLDPINKVPSASFQSKYTSVISDVLNKTTLRLNTPYNINTPGSALGEFGTINSFGPNTDYSISYFNIPDQTGSQAYKTFASVNFYDLNPISGDIYRIKTYAKSKTSLSDFELIGNHIVSNQNMLIDSSSINMKLGLGEFVSQNIIDTYWTSSGLNGASGISLTQNDDYLIEGMHISGSLNDGAFKVNSNRNVILYDNNQYKLRFNCYGITLSESSILKCYMSGSGFNNSDNLNVGKYIGKINFNENQRYYQNLNLYFEPDRTGMGSPVFIIEKGEWYLSQIEIEPLNEAGFTPNYFSVTVPINSVWDNNVFDFKFEFYDFTEKMADQIILLQNVSFSSGSPFYIQGGHNLITGSVFIGNEIGKGLKIVGDGGSYITSAGYEGFISSSNGFPAGFLIWSGSVLPSSGDNYSGIGMELFANIKSYFRFRTDESKVEIKTPEFYFGGSSQYLSGSNGSIEISSSGFYLGPDGTVTFGSSSIVGQRRNQWTTPDQIYYTDTIGSITKEFDPIFNLPCLKIDLVDDGMGKLSYFSLYFSYLIHDFVSSDSIRSLVYYNISPQIQSFETGSYSLAWSSSLYSTNEPVSDTFSNTSTPVLFQYIGPTKIFIGTTIMTSSFHSMTAVRMDNQDSSLVRSGQIVGVKLDINGLQFNSDYSISSASILLYGIRTISDL